MRYFVDTEFNGLGGALLSLAIVPADGGREFYVTLECADPIEPWVGRNVMPYLDTVPDTMRSARLPRREASQALSDWLCSEHELQSMAAYPDQNFAMEFVADWPEDIAHFCTLLLTGPGDMVECPPLTFQLLRLPGFSTAANSKVPHNALHDARALCENVCTHLD